MNDDRMTKNGLRTAMLVGLVLLGACVLTIGLPEASALSTTNNGSTSGDGGCIGYCSGGTCIGWCWGDWQSP